MKDVKREVYNNIRNKIELQLDRQITLGLWWDIEQQTHEFVDQYIVDDITRPILLEILDKERQR